MPATWGEAWLVPQNALVQVDVSPQLAATTSGLVLPSGVDPWLLKLESTLTLDQGAAPTASIPGLALSAGLMMLPAPDEFSVSLVEPPSRSTGSSPALDRSDGRPGYQKLPDCRTIRKGCDPPLPDWKSMLCRAIVSVPAARAKRSRSVSASPQSSSHRNSSRPPMYESLFLISDPENLRNLISSPSTFSGGVVKRAALEPCPPGLIPSGVDPNDARRNRPVNGVQRADR